MARAAGLVWLAVVVAAAGCSGPEEASRELVTATPLADRAEVACPRFARLPAAQTGLSFRNELRLSLIHI